MNSNKNIDRLFQERFKDFEAEPNKQTWKKIQLGLKEKKQRKIIPFWLKYAGIAALFIVGVFILNTFYKTNTAPVNKIVIETKSLNEVNTLKDSVTVKTRIIDKKTHLKNSRHITNKNFQKTTEDAKQSATTEKAKTIFYQTHTQKTAAFYNRKNYQSLEQIKLITSSNNSDKNIDNTLNSPNAKQSDKLKSELDWNTNLTDQSNLATAKIGSTDTLLLENTNELEAILKQKETKNKTEVVALRNKWLITPNVAAMFSNADGANIDPQFAENAKTTDNTIGYGITVNYAVNKKIAFRSGINKFALGYNINNVSYSSALSATPLANVRYNTNAMVEISSTANTASLNTFEKNLQKTSEGSINQNISYYEIPMEISYLLLDKKIGINVIGGFSTLLLDTNKISLRSPEINLPLGQANNLNAIHFTTNIGLGFKYKFVKSFQLNFEPVVKYQFNTFSNNSSNNRPMLLGLYSGISYSF